MSDGKPLAPRLWRKAIASSVFQLSQCLEKRNPYRGGKVQASNPDFVDGDSYHISRVRDNQFAGQTSRFRSKNQTISRPEGKIIMDCRCTGRKIYHAAMVDIATGCGKIGILFHSNVRPIIQARPFEIFVGDLETQRFDQVQGGMSGCAGPRDIAGVLRYFRLIEKDRKGITRTPVAATAGGIEANLATFKSQA